MAGRLTTCPVYPYCPCGSLYSDMMGITAEMSISSTCVRPSENVSGNSVFLCYRCDNHYNRCGNHNTIPIPR